MEEQIENIPRSIFFFLQNIQSILEGLKNFRVLSIQYMLLGMNYGL